MGQGRSAAKDPQVEGTSAIQDPRIEGTSAIQDPRIEGTSAAAESAESEERTQWPKNSIFHAPEHIRYGRESKFEPKLVSIGPYYYEKENLKHMEKLKRQLMSLIREKKRAGVRNPHRPSEEAIPQPRTWSFDQFMDSGKKARDYYKQIYNSSGKLWFDHGRPEDFVQMLVRDSCFIIRTILALSQQGPESKAFLDVHIKELRSDLLLLENQIPLFFIKEVYETIFIGYNNNFPCFKTFLKPFICLDMSWRINHDGMSSEAAHLLDLYWRCSLSPRMYMKLSEPGKNLYLRERVLSENIEEGRSHSFEQELPSWAEPPLSNNAPMVIANATELQKMAGIEFEKHKDNGHLDVIFSNGIMRMPRLKIDLRQITLLVNLIAFENSIFPRMRTFCCYMKLMDALIDSKMDVKLLQTSGVIYNTLNSHADAATFFNDIGNFCFIDNNTNPFSDLYKDVQKYYDSCWHRKLASLRQNYCSSPWAGISVVAAVTLLFLSAAQTFYSIYGYYKPKH